MTKNKIFLISSIISSLIVSFLFVVIYTSASTTISTNIDTGGTLTVSGNVGIGTTTPSTSLSIVAIPSATGYLEGTAATIYPASLLSINETAIPAGTTAGNLIDYIVNPPSNPGSRTYTGQRIVLSTPSSNTQSMASASLTGVSLNVKHQGSGNLKDLIGVNGIATHSGGGTAVSITGGIGSAQVTGDGIVTTLTGVSGVVQSTGGGARTILKGLSSTVVNTSTGIITNLYGSFTAIVSTAGTITNLYGSKIDDLSVSAGTINNTYGFYVGDVTAGTQTNTPYSFYASDPGAYNYFAGNVGIGTTTPIRNLQVTARSANATTTMEVGKANQNKGSCIILYDSVGTAYYCSVQGGIFTCDTTSCE